MAIERTRALAGPVPHPVEVLKDELEARGLSAHAGDRAAAIRIADQPDRSWPAGDHAGNRAALSPLFRRLGRDLAAPSGGV